PMATRRLPTPPARNMTTPAFALKTSISRSFFSTVLQRCSTLSVRASHSRSVMRTNSLGLRGMIRIRGDATENFEVGLHPRPSLLLKRIHRGTDRSVQDFRHEHEVRRLLDNRRGPRTNDGAHPFRRVAGHDDNG